MGKLKYIHPKRSNVPSPQTTKIPFTSAQVKSIYPNGDPNFFIPSYRQNQHKDEMANPYANNTWVYSACTAITTNLISLPRILDLKSTPEKEAISEHPILTLLDNPNPLMGGPTFWENVLLNLLLPTPTSKGGQCFILAESLTDKPVNLLKGDIPREMYPFSDQHITPILDKNDGVKLLGWKFQPSQEKPPILYRPEEVIRVFFVDPTHPLRGQCPLWATRLGLRQDLKAQVLNERFFDNNASLGGVLETDAELEPDTGKEIIDSFEERYTGQDNAGRPALLHSGLKYQMFQQSHQSMQFLDQRKWNREEILAAYGVPKFNIGVYEDLNFATAKAADKVFWQNTLVPLDQRVMRAFTDTWVCHVDRGQYRLQSDYSLVKALAPDLTEKLEQAKLLAALYIPVEEINNRLELQLDIDDYDWLKTSLIPANLMDAEKKMEEPDVLEEEEGMEATEANPNNTPPSEEEPISEEPVEQAMYRIGKLAKDEEKREAFKKTYLDEVILPDEKKFQKAMNTYFRQQRNNILDQVDIWANANKDVAKDLPIQKAKKKPDPDKLTAIKNIENKRLQEMALAEYIQMAEKEASLLSVELGESMEDWDVSNTGMEKVLKDRLKQVKKVNNTSLKRARNSIHKAVEQATSEGLGVDATAKLIKKEVNKTYKGFNAGTIARTETASIHSQTRMNIYTSNGITKISWQTAQDEKVRGGKGVPFSHIILDGRVAKITDGFNNGEQIMYPLDPNASASNVINCRCFVISQE